MNNVTFTYNEGYALAAGQSAFITESGAYVVTILEAKYSTSNSGAESIEFSVETDDGKKANYLHVYSCKRDKTPNKHGVNIIQAIMGCAGVQQLTRKMVDAYASVAPELTNKRVGLVLQKVLKTKTNGDNTYSFDILLPFIAQTRQTLDEKIKGLPAQEIDKRLATLKDKDERKPVQPQAVKFDDDIPF